jgi:hypothetical protein
VLFRPLHERADDVLLGGDPAEKVLLGGLVGLVVEDRRMTGVRDEVGHVLAIRHLAGVRGGSVEDDECGTRPHLADYLVGNFADQSVGDGHHDHVGLTERAIEVDALDADGRLQAPAALLRDLDVVDFEAGAFQVGGKADGAMSPSSSDPGIPAARAQTAPLRRGRT